MHVQTCLHIYALTFTAGAQNVNPIYNLLPDILSSLGTERDLPDAAFQVPNRVQIELHNHPICASIHALHPKNALAPIS